MTAREQRTYYFTVTWPTFPTPTPVMTPTGRVRRFGTRAAAQAHARRIGGNVQRRTA